jgi:hypothetical protein
MPRKRMDPFVASLIGHIPAEGPWPAEQRDAWFESARSVFNTVFGTVVPKADVAHELMDAERAAFRTSQVRWAVADGGPYTSSAKVVDTAVTANFPEIPLRPIDPRAEERRYTIDEEGFAMCDGRPVKFTDVPPGWVIHDLRTVDRGNVTTIFWHDCGTRLNGTMPPGVTLRS